jgi:tRNA threonylcarbamoyladenosine biosynthesis protein TsaE
MPATPAQHTLVLANEAATGRLAAAIAPCVTRGFTIFLSGDLGTGKTAFTRALLRALGHTGRVRSPTFTLAESYNLSSFVLYHFDFYRFSNENEWRDAGFEESIGGDHAAVVEWPELAGNSLPAPDLWLRLRSIDDEAARIVALHAHSASGQACLNRLANTLRETGLAGIGCWAPSAPPSSA